MLKSPIMTVNWHISHIHLAAFTMYIFETILLEAQKILIVISS